MFMSAAAQAPPPTQPSRSGRLLGLLRKLIDYGRELTATIRQRTATDPVFAICCFGTTDLAPIFARIARGLLLASALEARVLRRAAQLDAAPKPARARSAPRAPATPRGAATDPRLASLPTPAQIAAEIRRRPIGAVIADICRDLGITGKHPLWDDVQQALIEHRGSIAALVKDILDRAFSPAARRSPSALRAASLQFAPAGGTGPPEPLT
jgi:hypothetical protein